MGKDVIIACDFPSAEATLAFLDKFTGKKPFVKIGMELFYAEGPAIVKAMKERGHKIFLDLKLHDIPNTVKKAMNVLSRLDVDITNLHATFNTQIPNGSGVNRSEKAAVAIVRLVGLEIMDPIPSAVKGATELVGGGFIGTADRRPRLPFQIDIRPHFQSIPAKVFSITNHVGNQAEIVCGTDLIDTAFLGKSGFSACIFPL